MGKPARIDAPKAKAEDAFSADYWLGEAAKTCRCAPTYGVIVKGRSVSLIHRDIFAGITTPVKQIELPGPREVAAFVGVGEREMELELLNLRSFVVCNLELAFREPLQPSSNAVHSKRKLHCCKALPERIPFVVVDQEAINRSLGKKSGGEEKIAVASRALAPYFDITNVTLDKGRSALRLTFLDPSLCFNQVLSEHC